MSYSNMNTDKPKMTAKDFMVQEVNELIDLYKRTQFPLVSIDYDPKQFIKQKKRSVFDVLCDRLGTEDTKNYEYVLNVIISSSKSNQEAADKMNELSKAVRMATDISPETLICRNFYNFCKKRNIETVEALSKITGLPYMKMDYIMYFKKFAGQFIRFKQDNYHAYLDENLSFWRATKGESLPLIEKTYLWKEAIFISKYHTGACITTDLWETLKAELL